MEALIVLLAIYVAPSVVAVARKHPHRNAIIALNILTGWTFVGWVGALVWSLLTSKPTQRQETKPME